MKTTLELSPAARQALDLRAEAGTSYGGTRPTGRPNLSEPASAMLERYAYLVAVGVALLKRRGDEQDRPLFTPAHFCAAMDALNSTWITSETLPYVGEEVAEAIEEDGLGEKWELPDGAAALFESLTLLEQVALADLKERYWRGVTRGDNLSPIEFWEQVSRGGQH